MPKGKMVKFEIIKLVTWQTGGKSYKLGALKELPEHVAKELSDCGYIKIINNKKNKGA